MPKPPDPRPNSDNWSGLPILPALLLTFTGAVRASADDTSAPPSAPPPFKQLRYDENYAYLSDPALRTDFLDALKFIGLSKSGESYLTLGGEIRERYEYYHNSQWGLGPQDDNGYLLQRYMIHGDTHLGEWFRVFAQFKSGLED
ncbi:MAG TPA: alginate export family protein, partial [Verrucomicrobiae bacterium]|nr:alginate export family protein [Verrucomicrobiae bacterium]